MTNQNCNTHQTTEVTLALFASKSQYTGQAANTSFATVPTEITDANAAEFFRHDHTPILFENGHCKGENFVYAGSIVFDIDNSHSDNPDDWIHPTDIAAQLKALGVKFWLANSRNHLRSKDGKTPRPKFHVYLPLSQPLYDSDRFVQFCEWCIRTFNADPQVKSRAQKIFGYGDYPDPVIDSWNDGRCIDEVLTDDDLTAVALPVETEQKSNKPITPADSLDGDYNDLVRYLADKWKNHTSDLEALGWVFFERDGRVFFQTPDGNHARGAHDGNIKDGFAWFFSKAPPPFENNNGFTICSLFAGALFGNLDESALDKLAKRYLDKQTQNRLILDPKRPLHSAEKFVATQYRFNGIPTLIYYADDYWQWHENAYRKIEAGAVGRQLLHFLKLADIKAEDEDGKYRYQPFPVKRNNLNEIEFLLKSQIFCPSSDTVPFWIGDKSCEIPPSVTDTSLLIFGKSKILNLDGMEILPHSPHWLNIAALEFDYDPNAECPQWMAFLDSIFGDDEESKQTLMEWMGLCLTSITKFHKALFLVGRIRSGKGTFARILQKIVGKHNVVAPRTLSLGKDFGLQSFIGKTLAIVSDARFSGSGLPQIVELVLNITGEDTITISRKFREDVTLRLQTKLMFMSNEIPNVFDKSGAFPSRFIFLKLPNSFYGKEDKELEGKLSSELPGIFRLAIQHLQVLLERGHFIQPESGKELAERMTELGRPISDFIQLLKPYMTKETIWKEWIEYCLVRRQNFGTKIALWINLESAGYRYDFDKADILAQIRQHGGMSTVQKLRDSFTKYHTDGGTEVLKKILQEMVDDGLLIIRYERKGNGQEVAHYCIPKGA